MENKNILSWAKVVNKCRVRFLKIDFTINCITCENSRGKYTIIIRHKSFSDVKVQSHFDSQIGFNSYGRVNKRKLKQILKNGI